MTTINSVSLTYFGLVGRKLKPTANKFVLIRFRLIFKIKRLIQCIINQVKLWQILQIDII
jgi:hypothetical protein